MDADTFIKNLVADVACSSKELLALQRGGVRTDIHARVFHTTFLNPNMQPGTPAYCRGLTFIDSELLISDLGVIVPRGMLFSLAATDGEVTSVVLHTAENRSVLWSKFSQPNYTR